MARLIVHIDVNSAFLSWEATRRVSLGEEDIRLIPSAIAGDRDKRTGVILAKSIPAKKLGIKICTVMRSLKRCGPYRRMAATALLTISAINFTTY